MPDEPTLKSIADALADIFSKSKDGELLGAQIGSLLKQLFPKLDIKARFGGVRGLISQCAPDEITFMGKRGLDNIFSISRQLHPAFAPQDAWSIFHNPKKSGQLVYDLTQHRLMALDNSSAIDSAFIIRRQTEDDQREMIGAFIDSCVDEDLKPKFNQAVSGTSNYWKDVFAELNSNKLYFKWVEFRDTNLKKILVEKIMEFGETEELALNAAEIVYDAGKSAKKSQLKSSTTTITSRIHKKCMTPYSIQELARAIISEMNDQEISSLCVPLGKVWASLSKISMQ